MKRVVGFIVFLCISSSSFAYKNCTEQISSIYVGDNGWLWMTFKNGGVAHIKNTEVDFKNILSVVLAAHMASRDVVVRYWDSGNSATCSETRGDIQGVSIK